MKTSGASAEEGPQIIKAVCVDVAAIWPQGTFIDVGARCAISGKTSATVTIIGSIAVGAIGMLMALVSRQCAFICVETVRAIPFVTTPTCTRWLSGLVFNTFKVESTAQPNFHAFTPLCGIIRAKKKKIKRKASCVKCGVAVSSW